MKPNDLNNGTDPDDLNPLEAALEAEAPRPRVRRHGLIEVNRELAETHGAAIADAFGQVQFLPLRIEFDPIRFIYRYVGASPEMDEIEVGALIPTYTLELSDIDGAQQRARLVRLRKVET